MEITGAVGHLASWEIIAIAENDARSESVPFMVETLVLSTRRVCQAVKLIC